MFLIDPARSRGIPLGGWYTRWYRRNLRFPPSLDYVTIHFGNKCDYCSGIGEKSTYFRLSYIVRKKYESHQHDIDFTTRMRSLSVAFENLRVVENHRFLHSL